MSSFSPYDHDDFEADYDEDEHGYHGFADEDDRSEFADPGGVSALRAETSSNPRNLPCPRCHEPNRLTPKDQQLGYICDTCADIAEGGGY